MRRRGSTTPGSRGLASEPITLPPQRRRPPVPSKRGPISGRRSTAVAAGREDRHLDHRVVMLPAEDGELGVDEIVQPLQLEQLVEAARKNLGCAVDIPVREVEERPAFDVEEKRAQPAPPVL